MPMITCTLWPLLLTDIMVWAGLHLGISWGIRQVPLAFFEQHASWFRLFSFEDDGKFWQRHLRIARWKDRLPEGTQIDSGGFDKSHLHRKDGASLYRFMLETCRAELTHWLLLFAAVLFFLWNPLWAAVLNCLYAILANLPFILIQRYNRPRLLRVYNKFLRKKAKPAAARK
ncbi:glycosyl-4,4'-diaponeurosporenoate acyltransferase [Enterococcus sp. DIV0876]|uniref:glycosyl-4,4'-diaponeurosporenoate acyltransferase CrtO family protein n=1 Tax=Enterococcus sp. DIV0876 TaxID=2774633 RepID=UPI003D2FD96F